MDSPARNEFTAMLVVLFGEQVARDPQLVALLDRAISESVSSALDGYRRESEARIATLDEQLQQKTLEYNQIAMRLDALAPDNVESTIQALRDAEAALTAHVSDVTAERDALQTRLDDIAERIREAQRQAREQLDSAQARVAELEEKLEEAPPPGSLPPDQAGILAEAITEAMDAYRARTDAIAAEDESTARTEDARLTAAVRKAFHAATFTK